MGDRGLLDLIISRIPGISARERFILCKKFDREEEISILSKEDIEKILSRPLNRSWSMDDIRGQAEQDERTARRRDIRWVSWGLPEYPPQLREIFDPPAVLFFRGSLPDSETTLAAVVGTRHPAQAAAAQAYNIARELGAAGIPVVSGLALGIDAMAHRGNLDGGAPTVAVLGSGADEIYPAANRTLARRILEMGGVLISEYPPGTGPMRWHFPARNRIISGLARGTVIVEAPAKSGALITAQFTLDQGRDLWAASAGVASRNGAGTAKLAEEGAGVIESAAGILSEWNWKGRYAEEQAGPAEYAAPVLETALPSPAGKALAVSLARSLDIKL
ncbi:MAG: DNA-processing protein DprA [Treponema sp.]|jgi:DNA processing protein|nr:DNA-processing protein DprA [Treponema sp.]